MSYSLADRFAAAVAAAKQVEPALLAELWTKYFDEIPSKGVVRAFFNYDAPRPVLLQFAKQLEKLDPSVQVRVDSFGIQIVARRTLHDAPTFLDDPSYDKFAELAFQEGVTPALHAFLEWKFHCLQLSGDNLLWVRDPDSNSTQYTLCHGRVDMTDNRTGTFYANASCPSKVLPCWHVEQSHSLFSKLYPTYCFSKAWPADSRERVLDFNGRELDDIVHGTVTAAPAPAPSLATPPPAPVPPTRFAAGDLVYVVLHGRFRLCAVKLPLSAGGYDLVQGRGILEPAVFSVSLPIDVVPAEPFASTMPSQVQSNRLDPAETALFCTVVQAYMANSLIDIELHPTTRLAFYRGSKAERAFGKADHASSDILKAVWFGPDDLIVTLHCSELSVYAFDAIVTEPVFAEPPVPVMPTPAAEPATPAVTHKAGDLVVATDLQHGRYIARVVAVNSTDDSVRVHYLGFAEYFDEWIAVASSHRVGPPLPLDIAQVQLCVGTEEHLRLMLAILQCAPHIQRVLKAVVSVDLADGKGVVWYGDQPDKGTSVAQVQCTNGVRVSMYHRYDVSGDFNPIIALSASVGTAV